MVSCTLVLRSGQGSRGTLMLPPHPPSLEEHFGVQGAGARALSMQVGIQFVATMTAGSAGRSCSVVQGVVQNLCAFGEQMLVQPQGSASAWVALPELACGSHAWDVSTPRSSGVSVAVPDQGQDKGEWL